MKYYTIAFPGEWGQHVQETWSEDQILSYYLKYWSMRMIEASKPVEEMTRENCLQDWIVVHWAMETDEFGNTLNKREKFDRAIKNAFKNGVNLSGKETP